MAPPGSLDPGQAHAAAAVGIVRPHISRARPRREACASWPASRAFAMIQHLTGILSHPARAWEAIAQGAGRTSNLVYVCVLAVLPAVAWYYGTTRVGWSVGEGEVIRLTQSSATRLIVLFYLAMVVSVCIIGWFIHWMAAEYGAASTPMRGVSI